MRLTFFVHFWAFHSDCEDRVTTRWVLIHVCGTSVSIDISFIENFHHVLCSLHHKRWEIFDIHTSVFITEVKVLSTTFLGKQVFDLLIVNLQVWDSDQELLLSVTRYLSEDIFECSWHNPFLYRVLWQTCDGVSLSCTSLAICEDCSVVTCDDILTDRIGCFSKDVRLFSTKRISMGSNDFRLLTSSRKRSHMWKSLALLPMVFERWPLQSFKRFLQH